MYEIYLKSYSKVGYDNAQSLIKDTIDIDFSSLIPLTESILYKTQSLYESALKDRFKKLNIPLSEANENDLFFANFDNHPVNPGHMKLIPKRHINSLSDLRDEELVAMRDLLIKAKELINQKHNPDAYNIGVNEGRQAGQTVFHLHIHIIPRYKGDVAVPAGGIRNVIPERGNPKILREVK